MLVEDGIDSGVMLIGSVMYLLLILKQSSCVAICNCNVVVVCD